MRPKPKLASSGFLRVVSGRFKGSKLASPLDSRVHPMGNREKNALFNILQPYLRPNSRVLDAFAGTGALGIEALSRGAAAVSFVEKLPTVADLISANLVHLGATPVPLTGDIARSLPHLHPHCFVFPDSGQEAQLFTSDIAAAAIALPPASFDIIIADPPYDAFQLEQITALADLLRPDGVLALSHPAILPQTAPSAASPRPPRGATSLETTPILPGLTPITTRAYAAARLTFYHKTP